MVWGIKKDLRDHPLKRLIALKTAGTGRRCGAFRSPVPVRRVTGPAREPGLRVHQARLPAPAVRAVRAGQVSARARQLSVPVLALRQARPRAAGGSPFTPRAAPSPPTG